MSSFLGKMQQNFLFRLLNRGSYRSVMIKKQAIYSLLAKFLDALVAFLLVRITLTYLDEYEYGIWITLSSILTWINSLDIGFGNGLKNKLGEALAKNDNVLGRECVSTTFFALIFIAFIIFVLYSIASVVLDWNRILNISSDVPRLNLYVWLFFIIFLLSFVLKLIGTVYAAKLITSMVQFLHLLGIVLVLILVQVLIFCFKRGTFIEVGFINCLAPLFIYLLAYPYTFFIRFPELRPSIKFFRLDKLNDLLQMSWQFFFIQIAVVIFFLATNLIITQMFGPAHVTPYNIAHKYYSVLYMVVWVVISPIWSATTHAYIQNDIQWIKQSFRKSLIFFVVVVVFFLLMFSVSPFVFRIWLGNKVSIPLGLSFITLIHNIVMTYGGLICSYINGIGKIRLQLYGYWFCGVLYPGIAYFLGKKYGITGIIFAITILLTSLNLLLTYQFCKLMSGKARGLLNQ